MTAVAERRERTRTGWVWWMLAAVTLITTIAGATLTVNALVALRNEPRALVAQYLGALAQGDAQRAMGLGGIKATKDDVLLTDRAYRGITHRISSFSVGQPVTSGGRTTVTAAIVQGGVHSERSFAVTPEGGPPGLQLWKLAPVQPDTVTFTVDGPAGLTYTVDEVSPRKQTLSAPVTLKALPGVYTVDVASLDSDYAIDRTEVASRPAGWAPHPTVLDARLSGSGTFAARKAVDTWLDACIASTDAAPAGCPFETYSGDTDIQLGDVHWTLGTRPTVSLSDVWADGGWHIHSGVGTVSASAALTRVSDGATGTGETDDIQFAYAGTITFDHDGAHFAPAVQDGTVQG